MVPFEDEAYARLGDLLAWMFYPGRRPGLLGTAERIVGTAGGRPAELRRVGAGWTFFVDEQPIESFEDAGQALDVIPRHSFMYTTAIVTERIADLLFQGAVEQAEEGLRLYWESLAMTVRMNIDVARDTIAPALLEPILEVPLDDPINFVLATSLLDRSLRRSISAIATAIAAAEAQVNDWAADRDGWSTSDAKEGLVRKMKILAGKYGVNVDIGSSPFQDLHDLIDSRHDIIHPNALPRPLELGGTEPPGRGPSVRARKTCFYVRACLVDLGRTIGANPPAYLAYCPPAAYDDDDAWKTAIIATGARDDPDFPLSRNGP
jgi:hypothetical protein